VLVQLHGAGGHSGKRYGRSSGVGRRNLERLRKDLDCAIKNEDFERAVVIRDAMRGLKQGVK
jgi:protein-arginine kinase activator protein McsA